MVSYAVLYGPKGVKEFRNKDRAESFARKKANERQEAVSLDRVNRDGGFSQSTIKTIRPSGKPVKRKVRSKMQDDFFGDFGRGFF